MNEIDSYMKLMIDPKPDSLIRVRMEFKALDKPIRIKEQKLISPKKRRLYYC